MSDPTNKALDRLLAQMARPPRRRFAWFSTSPFILAVALALGYGILTRIVPQAWSVLLPEGLDTIRMFEGLPLLVWKLALICYEQPSKTIMVLGGVALGGFVLAATSKTARLLVWLAAVAAIALDACILYVTIRTAMMANGL